MSVRTRILSTTILAFWPGFLLGGVYGAYEGVRLMRSQRHIFGDFAAAESILALLRSSWLHGLLFGAAVAAVAALLVGFLSLRSGGESTRGPALPLLHGRAARLALALLFLVGLPWVFAPDGQDTADRPTDDERPNILLIVVDALRADRLGCYGYERPTTPNLDALCERSIVYEQAPAQFPATGPSFGSIFTGKYPRRHGLSAMDPRAWIGGQFNRTMAEILSEEGYATAAIMTGSITRSSGLARGFAQVYEEHPSYALHRVSSAWESLRARLLISRTWTRVRRVLHRGLVVPESESWLRDRPDRPFMLFVHLFEPHSPYDPKPESLAIFDRGFKEPESFYRPLLQAIRRGERELSADEVKRLEDLYDAEVLEADASVGRLLATLDEEGLREKTIVVVTADHGEELYEHGLIEHGYVYNTSLLTPLILDVPGRDDAFRVAGPVELIDLLPTLLDFVGVEAPGEIEGEMLPLRPRTPEEVDDAEAFAEADCQSFGGKTTSDCWVSIQTARFKLDHNRTQGFSRLFDLQADPLELRDVIAEHPEVAADLEARVLAWDEAQGDLEELREEISGAGREEIEKRLRALGYLE